MLEEIVLESQSKLAEFQNNLILTELQKLGYSLIDLEMKKIKLEIQLQRLGLYRTKTTVILKQQNNDIKLASYFTETDDSKIKVQILKP